MAESKLRSRFQWYLNRIPARFGREYVDTMMTAGAASSSTFLSDISIWLTEGLGMKEGSEIMKLFLHIHDGPFQFQKVRDDVICSDNFTNELGEVEESHHNDYNEYDENGQDAKSEIGTSWIARFNRDGRYYKVPVLDGDPAEEFIHATVQRGDQLAWMKSKGAPLKWFIVRELRPHTFTLLLENSSKKGEYKEIYLIQLYGAFVRRQNHWQPSSDGEICFQLPKPSFKVLQQSLEEIVKECEEFHTQSFEMRNSSSKMTSSTSTITKTVWDKEKDEKLKARLLVPEIDASVATDKESWLTMGRMLRSLSKGGNDLLPLWTDWTKKHGAAIAAVHDKSRNANHCAKTWDTFRPMTNCDDTSVVDLRSFFSVYDFSNKHSGEKILAENSASLTLSDIKDIIKHEINPKRHPKMWKQMEEVFAVADSVDTKELIFHSRAASCIDSGVSKNTQVASEQFSVEIKAGQPSAPAHVSMGSILASVRVGDLLRLPAISKFHGDHRSKSISEDWFKVVDVDVVFARIRLLSSHTPPYCWIDKPPKDLTPFWIAIANLWNILVVRTVSSSKKLDPYTRSINGRAEYVSFITPMDYSPEYALAYLSSLPTGPKSSPPKDEDPKDCYKLDIKVLQIAPESLVIAWSLLNTITGRYIRVNFERELTWVVSICPAQYDPHNIMPWKEIYKGTGEACQISALDPISQYQIKVEARIRPGIGSEGSAVVLSRYKLLATLPHAPLTPPVVFEWFVGASVGKIRLVGNAVNKNKSKETNLPEGCNYVFEMYMRDATRKSAAVSSSSSALHDAPTSMKTVECSDRDDSAPERSKIAEKNTDLLETSVFDDLFAARDAAFSGSYQPVTCTDEDVDMNTPLPDDENTEGNSGGWKTICKCRCGKLNTVVSISAFRNPVLFVRVRIANHDNRVSDPSPPLVFKLSNL